MTGPGQPTFDAGRWERRLLPGELVAPRDPQRSARDRAVDVAAFVLALAVGVCVLAAAWSEHSVAARVGDGLLGAVALAALWWRRSHPAAVAAIAIGASLVASAAAGAGIVALFGAAVRVRPRLLVGVVALALLSAFVYPLVYREADSYSAEIVTGSLLVAVTTAIGLFVRARRALVLQLHERAVRAEAEQELRVTQAREAERRRIAREMHDVLAHRVSLLSLHAGALEFRPDATPEEVAEAAGVIRATARATLTELRDVVGVLREDVRTDEPEPPQPTLAALEALVADARAAGLQIDTDLDIVAAADAPLAAQRTAYRIVQEGLTNAGKHAPAAPVVVRVRTDRAHIAIEVATGPPADDTPASPGSGFGLVGLAERVALAGGTFEHGPSGDGGFVLRARLPWTP